MSVLQTVQKNSRQFTYGQTVQKKQQTIYLWTDSAKKNNRQFTYGQTVQKKQQTIYLWTDSAKKQQQTIYIWTDSAKNCTGAFTVLQTVQKKKKTAIYIWTDSAKKQQQFTYGQYIFTDCTEDNVQNTHTYTHIHIVYYKDIIINDTLYTVWAHLHYVQYLYIM